MKQYDIQTDSMQASSTADWIPVTSGVAPDLPESVKIVVLLRNRDKYEPPSWRALRWAHIEAGGDVMAYRLAAPLPAQPVEGEWHITSVLPAEGRVVELRHLSVFGFGPWKMRNRGGKLEWLDAGGSWLPLETHGYEWRYPPGERAEATPIKTFQHVTISVINGKLIQVPTINAAGQESLAKSMRASLSSTVRDKPGETEVSPVPAAPQRQNLCDHVFAPWLDACTKCDMTGLQLRQIGWKPKPPLPPLHRVTVERERIRFLLAYKGRVPMTTPAKLPLAFQGSAYWTWRK